MAGLLRVLDKLVNWTEIEMVLKVTEDVPGLPFSGHIYRSGNDKDMSLFNVYNKSLEF